MMLYKEILKLMGNRFEIAILHENETWAKEQINCAIVEIKRIEQLFTTFSEDSITQSINREAGISPVIVPKEVFELIERCQKLSELTQGSFDITYGSLDKSFWNFDLTMQKLPDKKIAKKSIRLINYRNIVLDKEQQSVFLKNKGMRIGFGGIGKGYGAEMAKRILQKNGVKSGFVNAAGDLTAWGKQANGENWTIGIANPSQQNTIFSALNLTDMAVATSGNYEKFVIIDGRRYSHTINPKTGFPVSGIKSVSIITPNAELADAMATPIMVMGTQAGLYLINQMKQVACIIIDDNDKIFTSQNIQLTK